VTETIKINHQEVKPYMKEQFEVKGDRYETVSYDPNIKQEDKKED
jgi:hypothetical protein